MLIKHPGLRVKEELLPPNMTVTKAAQLLEIGRPALSNFLNGKAMLSSTMAQRLSKTFDFPLKKLMQWQTEYENSLMQQSKSPTTYIYTPPFLDIKANDIENWINTDEILSRSRFPVLLRTLIHSTNKNITRIDFPGNDDSQRPGWDGLIESNEATPWIPEGTSGWEFGVNKDIAKKANNDFNKSLNAHASDSSNITFIFVTPRRWPSKNKWVQEKKTTNKWKDVRVYDSSDLEQWIAQSLAAQSWLANEAKLPSQNVGSLDSAWDEWANVCKPNLNASFFDGLIKSHKDQIEIYLSEPPQKPFYIAADSKIEGIAFLSALLNSDDKFIPYRDSCLIFKDKNVLPHLVKGSKNFIAITTDNETIEMELAPYSQQIHAFVIYPKNTPTQNIDIKLEILDSTTFLHALQNMGYSFDKAQSVAKKSGYSLTVLRRQLSTNNAVKTPEWIKNKNQIFIPFLFAGTWDSDNKNDATILEKLANNLSYDDLEKELQVSLLLNDSPVWTVKSQRGIVSKIDLLFAIAPYIIKADLKHFFCVARTVLKEDNLTLDLAEEQQWAANQYNKKSLYSKNLKTGIREMLILLAIHGNELFQNRFNFDCESEVNELIKELLSPLSLKILQSNSFELSAYAEASPEVFLKIIENDLATDKLCLELLYPINNTIFSSPKYYGLLFALEKLAFDSLYVDRVVKILAQLSQKEIIHNYENKPYASLLGIFRCWYPATNVSTKKRIQLINELSKDFPEVGWRICISQLSNLHHNSFAISVSKFIWRNDCGQQTITHQDIEDFCNALVNIILNFPNYTLEKLLDLIEVMNGLTSSNQNKILLLVINWAKNATEAEKITMQEKFRMTFSLNHYEKYSNSIDSIKLSKQAYAALEPKAITDKYFWLFRSHRVNYSADEMKNIKNIDLNQRNKLIEQNRVKALKKIFKVEGVEGILELTLKGDCAFTIGCLLRRYVFVSDEDTVELIKLALDYLKKNAHINYKNIIRGILFEREDITPLLKALSLCLDDSDKVQIYLQSPFKALVWNLVDSLNKNYQQDYWDHITPSDHPNLNEYSDGVRYLLLANRPQTAFEYIQTKLKEISPTIIFEILSAMLLPSTKKENIQIDSFFLNIAFSQISNCKTFTLEQKARLEFFYIEKLLIFNNNNRNKSPIINLEMYLEEHPEYFIQLILASINRDDSLNNIDKSDIRSEKEKKHLSKLSFITLKNLCRIPGENHAGIINAEKLKNWVDKVFDIVKEDEHKNIIEYSIGELLSHCQNGQDGIWPCEAVRDLLEKKNSENLIEGMYIGKMNSRGATTRFINDGGSQEWEIVEQYKDWSKQLAFSHPITGKLLLELAKSYQNEAEYWDNRSRLHSHLR